MTMMNWAKRIAKNESGREREWGGEKGWEERSKWRKDFFSRWFSNHIHIDCVSGSLPILYAGECAPATMALSCQWKQKPLNSSGSTFFFVFHFVSFICSTFSFIILVTAFCRFHSVTQMKMCLFLSITFYTTKTIHMCFCECCFDSNFHWSINK